MASNQIRITQQHFLVVAALLFLVHPTHQQDVECGRSMVTSRIAGGMEATPNAFPWMAHLKVKFWSGDAAEYGGILIDAHHVLTAAHCLFGVISVKVTLGAHDVTSPPLSPSNQQIFDVDSGSNLKSHPDWNYGKVEDDIALIRLPNSAYFNEFVQPACLPFAGDSDQVNDPVVLAGWGNFSSAVDSGFSPVLRQTETTVISSFGTNGQCQQTAGLGSFSGEKVICSDGSQGHRFCYGDDGGPMNFYNAEWDRWFVVGVAGVGDSSVGCPTARKPNVFTRVRGYLDWIGGITGLKPITTTTTTTTTDEPTDTTTETSTDTSIDTSTVPTTTTTTTVSTTTKPSTTTTTAATVSTTTPVTSTTTSVTTAPSSSSTVTISSTSARTTTSPQPSGSSQAFSFLSLSLVSISFLLSCVIQSN